MSLFEYANISKFVTILLLYLIKKEKFFKNVKPYMKYSNARMQEITINIWET